MNEKATQQDQGDDEVWCTVGRLAGTPRFEAATEWRRPLTGAVAKEKRG